ncbi:MAG TPA: hypothetical protein VNZ52_10500 [Candidatus Thermoplasmatota archaeon]|nr:hypothetical protein [Candidatus Thermoplasmatota archaeon]
MPGTTKRSPATPTAKAHSKKGKAKARTSARKETIPLFPVAYVKYHDHCWLESKDLKKIQDAEPYVVEETGFLLHEAERFVTLAKERSTDGEKGRVQYDDVTIIMRSDILELKLFPLE